MYFAMQNIMNLFASLALVYNLEFKETRSTTIELNRIILSQMFIILIGSFIFCFLFLRLCVNVQNLILVDATCHLWILFHMNFWLQFDHRVCAIDFVGMYCMQVLVLKQLESSSVVIQSICVFIFPCFWRCFIISYFSSFMLCYVMLSLVCVLSLCPCMQFKTTSDTPQRVYCDWFGRRADTHHSRMVGVVCAVCVLCAMACCYDWHHSLDGCGL